jgi:uncharacterized membrane protein
MSAGSRAGPLLAAGLLLGTGLGGFVDGILFHQILQWHNMLSTVVPPADLVSMKYNMIWDGLFHALTWLVTVAGLTVLWFAGRNPTARWSGEAFVGGLACGWGAFNVVEGIVDHHLLGLHHVRPGPHQLAWDWGFLVFGATLVAAGLALVRRDHRAAASR